MGSGLNFNRVGFITILSFVSLWIISTGNAQTSGQEKDEFLLFEEELKESAAKPKVAPKAPAQPPESSAQKVERLKAAIRKTPKNTDLIVELAEEFLKKGEAEKTTLLLWKQVDKLNRNGLIILAKAHEKRKEPSEMIRALNIQIGKDPKDFEAHSLLGSALLMQKKLKEAKEAFKTSVDLNSKYEPAYRGLAEIYERPDAQNLYELRILFQDMVDNIGPKAEFLSKLCEINTKDAVYESAVPKCKEAIQKDNSIASNHVYLGLSYKEIGDTDLAQVALKKAADKFTKSELAQYTYAKLLEEQKNYIDALKYYKQATDNEPKSVRSWLGLANSSFEVKKYDVALEAYKKACALDTKNAVAFRRATTVLRNTRTEAWVGKFEAASESCTFR